MKSKRVILVLMIILIVIIHNTVFANNGEETFQQNKNDENQEMTLSQQQVMRCLSLTKDEVLAAYGHNFEIVRTGSEGEQEGYYYKNLGITFVYRADGEVMRIECKKSITINGAKAGMTFAQIKEKLGDAPIKQGFIEAYFKIYILEYEVDNARIAFSSFNADGTNSRLIIVKKRSY